MPNHVRLLVESSSEPLANATKVQAIRRKKAVSQCYVNLTLPLAAAIEIEPGEMVEWKVDTRYKLWLIRQRPKKKNN